MNERYRNEAAETAQRLAAEEILTVLAHDLRNYLTPLTGRIELLERRAHREKDESYERQLDTLSQGMKRLQSLTANLLDAERLRQGLFSLDYQPVDLAEIVEEVLPIWSLPDHPCYSGQAGHEKAGRSRLLLGNSCTLSDEQGFGPAVYHPEPRPCSGKAWRESERGPVLGSRHPDVMLVRESQRLVEKGHGRLETRKHWALSDPALPKYRRTLPLDILPWYRL